MGELEGGVFGDGGPLEAVLAVAVGEVGVFFLGPYLLGLAAGFGVFG